MFKVSHHEQGYYPDPQAILLVDYQKHFEMFGRIIGKCILENDNYPVQIYFEKFFLKLILSLFIYIYIYIWFFYHIYNLYKYFLFYF